jgi:hypothetical protein
VQIEQCSASPENVLRQQAASEIVLTPPMAPEAHAPASGASTSSEVATEPRRSSRLRDPLKTYGGKVLLLDNGEPAT